MNINNYKNIVILEKDPSYRDHYKIEGADLVLLKKGKDYLRHKYKVIKDRYGKLHQEPALLSDDVVAKILLLN